MILDLLQPVVDFGSDLNILSAKSKENLEMLADLNSEQRALADYMSELSEKAWHAGWIAHLEYDLWDAVTGGTSSFGQIYLTAEQLRTLRNLSERCGG